MSVYLVCLSLWRVSIWCVTMVCAYLYGVYLWCVRVVASRHLNLGLGGSEVGWLTAYTAATHWVATKSITLSPISEIGGHLAGGRGAILKGAGGLTFGRRPGARGSWEASGAFHLKGNRLKTFWSKEEHLIWTWCEYCVAKHNYWTCMLNINHW